jgi:hypothetical protein
VFIRRERERRSFHAGTGLVLEKIFFFFLPIRRRDPLNFVWF